MARKRTRKRGTGGVRTDKNGQVWYSYVDEYGKQRRRRARSEQAAEVALDAILEGRKKNLRVTDGQQRLETYFDYWLKMEVVPAVNAGDLKPRTLEHYTQLINAYIVPFIGQYSLVSLSAPQLSELRNKLRAHLVPDTVNAVLGLLSRALRDAVTWRFIDANPASKDSVKRARRPADSDLEPPTEAQVRALLAAADAEKAPAKRRLAFAMHVKATTGVRMGELLGLRWVDVNLDEGWFEITQQIQQRRGADPEGVKTWKGLRFIPPKTAAGRRRIIIAPRLLDGWRAFYKAERLRAGEFGLVFTTTNGTPVQPTNMAHLYYRWRDKANEGGAGLTGNPHRLRHFVATLLGESGAQDVVVKRLLGHGKRGVTERYQKSRLPAMRKAMYYVEDQLWTAGLEKEATGT